MADEPLDLFARGYGFKALDEPMANAIYQVLVETCGAHESDRQHFVHVQTSRMCDEHRFGGNLGFGGKFRRNAGTDPRTNEWGEQWYVDYYAEDKTADRQDAVHQANNALSDLKRIFYSDDPYGQYGKWLVQVGNNAKGKYRTKYAFKSTEKHRSILWYDGIVVHSGGKKRLVDPNGNVHLRELT